MNYFAHATIATRLDPDARFVLGAMLPDFSRMLGARIRSVEHPVLREGVDLHHRTDAAFHRARPFARLVRDGVRALDDAGLRRGPARGAAHVGVELLLDGALLGAPASDRAYLDALDAAPHLGDAIGWSVDGAASRWGRLVARLREAGLPTAYRDVRRVADRVERALARHPRLRLRPPDRAPLRAWLHATAPAVRRAAPELVTGTLEGLGASGAGADRAPSARGAPRLSRPSR